MLDSLKPDREEVEQCLHGGTVTEGEPETCDNTSVDENASWDCSIVAFVSLHKEKDDEEDSSQDEQNDNASIGPAVGHAAPLQRQ